MMSIHLLIKSLLRRKVVTVLLFLQLAMTLGLLVNSVLLARQAHDLLNVETGLPLDEVITILMKPTVASERQQPALQGFIERQLAAVRQVNGVVEVAISNQSTLEFGGSNGNVYDQEHEETTNVSTVPNNFISPDYFKVLGAEVLEGEIPAMPAVFDSTVIPPVVLTKSLAEKLFGTGAAVGRQTNRGRVDAVVSDFHGQRFATDLNYNLMIVTPMPTADWGYVMMVRVSSGMLDQLMIQLPEVIRAVDANVEIFQVRSLRDKHNTLYANERGLATLLTVLAILMLLVAMVSSYSNAFFHAQKMHQEIGIKRALGASKHLIFIELLSENWLTTAGGCVLGILFAWGLNQMLALVISIPAVTWWLPLLVLAMLMLCVTLATWYPARIATGVSPATATKTL
jgi:putative ABC transport system permease protein